MKDSKKIPISKILTIESYDEDATRQLMHTLYKSAEFKDYKIDHFYCQTSHEETFDKEALFQRLKKKIYDFEPQIILIHTGGFFLCNQQTFETLLSEIKKQNDCSINSEKQCLIGVHSLCECMTAKPSIWVIASITVFLTCGQWPA